MDETMEILRELADSDEDPTEGVALDGARGPARDRVVYLVHKTDNLEAIVWQLYEAGYRPNLKYGVGRLSWVCLDGEQDNLRFQKPAAD